MRLLLIVLINIFAESALFAKMRNQLKNLVGLGTRALCTPNPASQTPKILFSA